MEIDDEFDEQKKIILHKYISKYEECRNLRLQNFSISNVIIAQINEYKELLNSIFKYILKIKTPDYHPGSEKKVLNIVHPSSKLRA